MKSQKKILLEYILQNHKDENYDKYLILEGLKSLSLEPEYYDLLFPSGLKDFEDSVIEYLREKFDDECLLLDLAHMRLSERIVALLKLNFTVISPYRRLLKKISTSMMLSPFRLKRVLWSISDHLWVKALDQSVYFDYYTKRISLSIIYSKIFLFFLNDQSGDSEDTIGYISRAIRGHLELTRKLKNFSFSKIPIFRFLVNYRYRK